MDRIYTGFESLDKHLNIYKGDLVVIGARPAIGKTCFMCSMIENTFDKQNNVFFSMQTEKHKAIERLQFLGYDKRFVLIEQVCDLYDLFLEVLALNKENQIDAIYIDNFSNLVTVSDISSEKIVTVLKNLAVNLNVAIIVSDSVVWHYKSNPIYRDLTHKDFIKYADKIIIINRPDRTATEKDFRKGLVEKNVAEIMINKDMEEYYSPWINLKFDNTTFTFNEIPKTS